jgi:hypothetical protein
MTDEHITYRGEHDTSPVICYIRELPTGEYIAHFKISSGAPALASIPYHVTSYYDFCGMEMLPVGLCAAYGLGFSLLSILLASAIIIITLFKRKKLRLAATSENTLKGKS